MGLQKYWFDLVYVPTGEVILENAMSKEIGEIIGRGYKSIINRFEARAVKSTDYGNYRVVLKEFTPCKAEEKIEHESLDDIVKEFFRVCNDPKLWSDIHEEYMGDWYINDQGKAVMRV